MDGLTWMLELSALAAFGGYLWTRSAIERPPAFPLQYAPPPGIGGQADYIRTEKVPRHRLTATLFHLAEQDLVTLVELNSKQWEVRGTTGKSRWAVDPVGVAVGPALKVIGTGPNSRPNTPPEPGRSSARPAPIWLPP